MPKPDLNSNFNLELRELIIEFQQKLDANKLSNSAFIVIVVNGNELNYVSNIGDENTKAELLLDLAVRTLAGPPDSSVVVDLSNSGRLDA